MKNVMLVFLCSAALISIQANAKELPLAKDFAPSLNFVESFIRYDGSKLISRQQLEKIILLIQDKDYIKSNQIPIALIELLDYNFYGLIRSLSDREKEIFETPENISIIKNK